MNPTDPMDDTASLEAYLWNRDRRPRVDAPGSDRLPRGADVRIPTSDGIALAATVWDGRPASDAGRSERVVVVASATGVLRRYYATFAAWLSARGFAVVTFDYRGIGDSREGAGAPEMHDWGERDLAAAVAWADDVLLAAGGSSRPGRVAVIGHSVGGQLVGLLPDASRVGALVTVGAQSGDFRLWPLPSRLAMAVLWYGVVPGVTHAVGYLPGALGIGEDLPAGVALEWARWCRTPGYLAGDGFEDRREGFARLDAPVLAFGFDDDAYAPRAAIDALMSLFSAARVERRQLGRADGRFGHFGFFRERNVALWRTTAEFLERHAAGVTSASAD